jgi:hypothetical protein
MYKKCSTLGKPKSDGYMLPGAGGGVLPCLDPKRKLKFHEVLHYAVDSIIIPEVGDAVGRAIKY